VYCAVVDAAYDRRVQALVDDLTSVGQELIDTYTPDDGRIVGSEVTAVTAKYDEVKRDIRQKLHLLNEALQPTVNDVSLFPSTHSLLVALQSTPSRVDIVVVLSGKTCGL